MKQHITREQLEELSEKAKGKLKSWWKPEIGDIMDCNCDNPLSSFEFEEPGMLLCKDKNNVGHSLPLLSIGQMIEFLDQEQKYQLHIFRRTLDWKVVVGDLQYGKKLPGELCDFLWEAVKDVLENEND